MEPPHRLRTYYGYAFESYATCDTPSRPPPRARHGHAHDKDRVPPTLSQAPPTEWGGDVNTNVQWCNVVKTKLGNTRIVIGGECDCVRGGVQDSIFT